MHETERAISLRDRAMHERESEARERAKHERELST